MEHSVFGGAAERRGPSFPQPLLFVLRLSEPLNDLAPAGCAHPEEVSGRMPSPKTRLQKKTVGGAARQEETRESLLAEAADQLSNQIEARKAAEARVAELEARFAAQSVDEAATRSDKRLAPPH